jgi:putative membrane protein
MGLHPFGMHGCLGFGGVIFGVIAFFVAIMFIMMVARLVLGPRHRPWMHGNGMAGNDPLEIAKGRYAKGEISKEQFEQIKKDIS